MLPRMTVYRLLHVLKFVGVSLLAGGTIASFVAHAPAERRLAAHTFASSGLLLTWVAGYLLSLLLGVGLRELWTSGGLVLSFAAHLALLRSVNTTRSTAAIVSVSAPLFLTLLLMVFRPTWSQVLP
jgi:hypothetical protein